MSGLGWRPLDCSNCSVSCVAVGFCFGEEIRDWCGVVAREVSFSYAPCLLTNFTWLLCVSCVDRVGWVGCLVVVLVWLRVSLAFGRSVCVIGCV